MSTIDGKDLKVTPAGFGDVMALQKAISDALKENGIKLNLSGFSFDVANLEKMEIGDIGGIIESVLSVATDPDLRTLLFKCAERSLFENNKVNEDFFEKEENRKYYFPIMFEVLKVNLSPFFGLASSLFSNLSGIKDLFQKQK